MPLTHAPPERDVAAVRLAARGRVVVATVCVIAASLARATGSGHDAVVYALGLFWLPWSGYVALNADRLPPRFTRLAGAAGDLAMLFTVGAVANPAPGVVGLGCLITALVVTYPGGWTEGVGVSVASVVVLIVANAISASAPRLHGETVVLFTALLAVVVLVVERSNSRQRLATLRSERLAGRAGAVLERVADGVVVTDARGRVLEANPAAARLMGCGMDEVGGRACADVLGLAAGELRLECSHSCGLLGLLGDGRDDRGCEVWRLAADGRRRPLLASASAILSDDGRVQEVVHSLRDITSLKQADEAKTLFLATASHELKTPLTVIRGFGEVLAEHDEVSDELRREAARAIVRRAEELAAIVDRLLVSSRIEAGRLKLDVVEVAVAPILVELGTSLEAATGRRVLLDIPDDLPMVDGDAGAITTVFDHLLDNAVKYSAAGGAVELSAFATASAVEVRVCDQGIGMDPEQAAQCFDKFWQAESTDVRRFKGTGIGLYIVRSLVEAMSGRVDVQTAPGRGSTFVVTLPRASAGGGTGGPGVGEPSIVREFMRQLGIPEAAGR